MSGEHAVGRVIARPFTGARGRVRAHRRAGATSRCAPPARSYLQELEQAGVEVHGVGKIGDLFAGRRRDALAPGRDERAGARRASSELLGELERGLVFANLIETDQVYGHRKDVGGFARRAAARSTRGSRSCSSACARTTC